MRRAAERAAPLLASDTATGQQPRPCTRSATAATPITLSCGGGLRLEVERGADLRVVDADGDRTPEGARLRSGAALVERTGGDAPFQILTPTASASVRGTSYAVDAAPVTTAVFVLSGAVNGVARASGAGVVLRRGEETDVPAGTDRLVARRWGQGRIDALLRRFGR